ncbi:hypothetical protein GYMLUDRAFT_252801 [Collybiopsis luxurians FD-317 M1]|uniref:Uncharacterized protein n=1 Tax=Collybiopsis luxurians FD-317 M1 TaxID=944289 RepID=A0A0D0AKD1_9AGAR|nr:hypothetical protein GYMLUDRAFT_252801 [Collybiopsis luxurians FD-317 M1]
MPKEWGFADVYNFSPSDGTSVAEPHPKKIPSQLAKLLGSSDHRTIHLHSCIEAPTGAYAVKGTPGRGNSFVCFCLSGEREWKAGKILYIFEQENKVKIVLQQLIELDQPEQDPFCGWWDGGFEAKLVSASVSSDLKIIDQECIVGHAAYWNLVDGLAAVVNLSQDAAPQVSTSLQKKQKTFKKELEGKRTIEQGPIVLATIAGCSSSGIHGGADAAKDIQGGAGKKTIHEWRSNKQQVLIVLAVTARRSSSGMRGVAESNEGVPEENMIFKWIR